MKAAYGTCRSGNQSASVLAPAVGASVPAQVSTGAPPRPAGARPAALLFDLPPLVQAPATGPAVFALGSSAYCSCDHDMADIALSWDADPAPADTDLSGIVTLGKREERGCPTEKRNHAVSEEYKLQCGWSGEL